MCIFRVFSSVQLLFSVVSQYYEAQVYDVFVIKGNTAVFKCHIPSFVSDHVEIVSWQDTQNTQFLPPTNDYGIHSIFSLYHFVYDVPNLF